MADVLALTLGIFRLMEISITHPRNDYHDEAKRRWARDLAKIVHFEASKPLNDHHKIVEALDPFLVIAVIQKESSSNPKAVGKAGELGLGQLLRGTRALRGFEDLPNDKLMEPRLNVRLMVRHLAWARDTCGGPPENWLSHYNGLPCGRSKYSEHVLSLFHKAIGQLLAEN